MAWVFWLALGLIGYAYFGYPTWLWVQRYWRARPVKSGAYQASISVIMVVRNEAPIVESKLRNLLGLNCPTGRMEIIVVSDGSSDRTNDILTAFSGTILRTILNDEPRGKAACLNDAICAASGDIVVFTDARQSIEPDAIRFLLENFADPEVGCVSGELMLGSQDAGESARGTGLYWRMEKKIREMESACGSVIGATGALYAVRRSLLPKVPPETILDDVYIPLHVLRQGRRVVFEARARAWDVADQGREREFARKVRTLSGNFQLLRLSPWLLGPANPVWFGFVSHKLMRLFVPLALTALLISSFFAEGTAYRFALALQVSFYAFGVLALVGPKRGVLARIGDVSLTFVLLNTAAIVALANFVTGRRAVWAR